MCVCVSVCVCVGPDGDPMDGNECSRFPAAALAARYRALVDQAEWVDPSLP